MSKISDLIFNGGKHYMSSPFGQRGNVYDSSQRKIVSAGFHQGTDYATNNVKIPQYAIENGYVFAVGKSTTDGALYVWVIYPRIKKAFIHYHLDSFTVKAGQTVAKGTQLGCTGMTGNATGIHLHLGIRDLNNLSDSQIDNLTWGSLQSCPYIDPEAYALKYSSVSANPYQFTESKKYITRGDKGNSVKWVQWELTRLGYNIGGGIDGLCGPITTDAIRVFQKHHNLLSDGKAGPITRAAMAAA